MPHLREAMERLVRLTGSERPIDEVTRELYFYATVHGARVTGAMHVTCADEAEIECIESFRRGFVEYIVPKLRFGDRSAFHIANLGGRYEWGGVRVAEEHFATPESRKGHKLLVVKVNSHVAVREKGGTDSFGSLDRYDRESPCCGALKAVLDGSTLPFAGDIREAFLSENTDRIAALRDPARVEPRLRSLYAALVSARCQARQVMLDIQDHRPLTPTYYIVVPCATLNREGRDTEIVCGIYTADHRGGEAVNEEYFGLGDDPSRYRIRVENSRYIVEDDGSDSPRPARDHRRLVLEAWSERDDGALPAHGTLEKIREAVVAGRHRDHSHAKALLRAALPLLADIAPVPGAILAFAHGFAEIHHAHRVHRLAKEMAGTEEARRILREVHEKVGGLEPDRARALIELLARDYRV